MTLTPTPLSARRRWASLSVLVAAVLLLAIDATVLYLAVPSISQDLAPSATQLLWIGDIYSLALAGFLITMGTLADRIGRKKLLLIGAAAFGLASIAAAFATSPEMLIAARLLLGVAGATLMPSTLALIRDIFTDPGERTRAIAIWSAAAAGGAALGPLAGGLLLENFWWGSVFLINVPVMIVLIIAGSFLLRESRNPDVGRFDLVSSLLSLGTVVPFVYAIKVVLTAGVSAQDGTLVQLLVALVVSLLSGAFFVRRQRRLVTPLIEVSLFRNAAFSASVAANFFAIFAMTGVLYFFSQYLQLARGLSPLQAGLAELPAALASVLVIALVAWVLRRLGTGRGIAIGLAMASVSMILIAAAEGSHNLVWLILALVPLGLGVGVASTLTTNAVVSAVPPTKAGAASSIAETAYELGVALGIAVLGSILTLNYRHHLALPPGLDDATQEAARDSLPLAISVLDEGSEAALAAQEAFTTAIQVTSLVGAAIVAIGALVAFRFIPNETDPASATAH